MMFKAVTALLVSSVAVAEIVREAPVPVIPIGEELDVQKVKDELATLMADSPVAQLVKDLSPNEIEELMVTMVEMLSSMKEEDVKELMALADMKESDFEAMLADPDVQKLMTQMAEVANVANQVDAAAQEETPAVDVQL